MQLNYTRQLYYVNGGGLDVLFYGNVQPMWIFDTNSLRIIEVNNAAVLEYGYTKQEFLDLTIADLRPEEDIPHLYKALSTLRGHSTTPIELRHRKKNGATFYVEAISYSTTFNGVDARLVQAINIDGRKAMVQELKTTQIKLGKILETINIGFCQLNGRQEITYWNTAAELLIGYKREHVLGRTICDVLPEMVYTEFYNLLQPSIQNKEYIEFIAYFWPLQKYLSVTSHPAEDGQTIHFKDATYKIQFQKSLLKKIEQLKHVSYLNSHLVRKPVASLMGLTSLISEGISDVAEYEKIAGYIYECSLELNDVVHKVNNKISEDAVNEEPADDLSVFGILGLLEEIRLENNCMLTVTGSMGPVHYFGNRTAIKTAIQCLVHNAENFSPEGQNIILRAGLVEQNLVVWVSGTGPGISDEMIERLFWGLTHADDFKSSGTGLTFAAEVARNHHGSLSIESRPGEGAVFSFNLPLSNIAAQMITGNTVFGAYKKPVIQIDCQSHQGYLVANFKGFHDACSVKAGCQNVLDALQTLPCAKLLVDHTNMIGIWEGAVDFITTSWFPSIERAGITHIALVYAKSAFAKISADNMARKIHSPVKFKTFYDRGNAINWLGQQ